MESSSFLVHVECLTRNVSKNGTLGKGKVIFAMIIDTLGCLAKKTKLGQSESVFASYPQACQRRIKYQMKYSSKEKAAQIIMEKGPWGLLRRVDLILAHKTIPVSIFMIGSL